MDITIQPRKLRGSIQVIPSKSQAHRLLICAAFSDLETELICPETSRDMDATAACLNALGAVITRTKSGYHVIPVHHLPASAQLPCRDSGSTLRFLLPVVGALGVDSTFLMEGRLPQRPLSPLWEEMERMGCSLSRPTPNTIRCTGKLKPGDYSIDGGISSQFITGLLFALSLMEAKSKLTVTGNLESKPYITLTEDALQQFGQEPNQLGGIPFRSPGCVTVEGDWSNGAFFQAANFLGCELDILGLRVDSKQGDRSVMTCLDQIAAGTPEISVKDIPDLVPILAVAAAASNGAVFSDTRRLRLKESDRIASTIAMIENLGGSALADQDKLTVPGTGLTGGTVDSANDHRIAMAAAIASTVCTNPVTILGAEAVEKSYPRFWEEFSRLGGKYEFNIR